MSKAVAEYEQELADVLRQRFAGCHLQVSPGPRSANTISLEDVRQTVLTWLRDTDGDGPPYVMTTAQDARARGEAVPDHVPDYAVYECDDLVASLEGSRINISPKGARWAWDTLSVIGPEIGK